MTSDAQLLGLCMLTESDLPHEWRCIGWTVRNRVLSPRYPDTVAEVILQPKQFSAFNGKTGAVDEIYKAMSIKYSQRDLVAAAICADEVLAEGSWHAPFGRDVLHYYSPVSMVPKGSKPPWAATAARLFTPPGIDERRFVYAAGVR